MEDGWIRVGLIMATTLTAIGATWGSLKGRILALEKAEKKMEATLGKHSDEIDKLIAIRLDVVHLGTKMDHLTELLKEMRDRRLREDENARTKQ